jgi:hypothetical protein
MANTTQIGAITLNDVQVKINGNIISMIQSVKVGVKKSSGTLYQAGAEGEPVGFVQTKKEYTGSIDRTFVDTTLLSTLTPNSGDFPEFELQGVVKSSLNRGEDKDFVAYGCLCEGFDLELNLDNETKSPLNFKYKRFEWI